MKEAKNNIRHPTEKKHQNPTYTHTPISIGKQERALLRYLYKNNNSRFNVKGYHRLANLSRSTVYDYLDRLESYGFVKRETANNRITNKGIILLTSSEGVSDRGVGSVRRECRKEANLSTHYHKFKLPISDKQKFLIENLDKLTPLDVRENKLNNLHQIIVEFEDGTILINPKQLIINLFDVITEDVAESDFKCITRAIEYVKKFMDIGVITEGIILEEGHWARVESILSDFLYEKVDNRYFLDLGKGRKFWIDHSHKREDETNDKVVRERIDTFLTDVANSDISLLDIDKITKALGFISKLESSRLMNQIDQRKNTIKSAIDEGLQAKNDINNDRPSYVG